MTIKQFLQTVSEDQRPRILRKIYLCLNFLYGQLFREDDLLLLPDKGNLDSCSPTLTSRELGIETAICRIAFVQFADHITAYVSDVPSRG